NLGVSLTFLRKKVVLVDLDLRKGTLTNRIKSPMPVGMTHYLSDPTINVKDVIYKDRLIYPGLVIITIGLVAPILVELFITQRHVKQYEGVHNTRNIEESGNVNYNKRRSSTKSGRAFD